MRTLLKRLYRRSRADRWSSLFGQVAVYSFVVTAITGVFLLLYYKPSMTQAVYHGSYRKLDGVPMSQAYRSTLDISFDVRGGLLMRQVHHWAALLFIAAVCAWWMVRSHRGTGDDDARTMYRPATILGCLVALTAAVGLFFTGDTQGKLMFHQQPMKMASAESLCATQTDPDFSILTVGRQNNCDSLTRVLEVPYVLPFLAEGRFHDVKLQGVRDIQRDYQHRFGPGDYRPNLFVTYWSFRAMIGFLLVPVLFALVSLWVTRGNRVPGQRWFSWLALLTIPSPFLANSAGWVFTEMGRQPWVVAPNPTGDQQVRLTVAEGVSSHAPGMVVTSLVMFTLVYGVLAVIWFWLLKRYVVEGPQEHDAEPAPPTPPGADEIAPLSFAY